MTGGGATVDQKHGGSPTEAVHNRPEVVWERWVKKRTFVRALEGTYSNLQQSLLDRPRVYSTRDMPWKGGPQMYGKHAVNPQRCEIAQSIETHIHCNAPGGASAKHGHMNSAVFYVLRGRGYDVHDGERLDYRAGDVLIVENGCVHQHCNGSDSDEMVFVVMKAKPLFLFMHMVFQKTVKLPPSDAVPGIEDYTPPRDW